MIRMEKVVLGSERCFRSWKDDLLGFWFFGKSIYFIGCLKCIKLNDLELPNYSVFKDSCVDYEE